MNVLDVLENTLRTCLCEMLIAEERPVCACHHYGGEDPPVGDRCKQNDEGENGQAWVRRVSQSMTVDPDDITFGGEPCGGVWTAQIELGIYRCIQAIPGENGAAPDPELYNADRELLAADRATLAQVLCCWPLAGEPPEPLDYELNFAVTAALILPTGPSGGCAGSILTITVETGALVEEEETEPIGFVGFVSRPAGGG